MNIRNRMVAMINSLDMGFGGRSQYSWPVIAQAIAGQIINNGLSPTSYVAAAIVATEIWDGEEGDGWMADHTLHITREIERILESLNVNVR